MTPVTSRLLAEALQLTEAERSELIARLLDSLEPPAEEAVETAWGQEIQRRSAELDAGTAQGVPWSEARRLIMEDTDDALES
jgi:putative addiction module component (TIGR02574 family)